MRRKNIKARKKIVALDFFCGCGGVTKGLQGSGIKVLAGFDNNPEVGYAYNENNKGSEFYEVDVAHKEKNLKIVKKLLKPYDPLTTVTVFTACAPCQPFSAHNKDYKNKKDNRRNLMRSFIDIIEGLPKRRKPSFVFAENVGPMKSRGKEVLKKVLDTLEGLDYKVLEPKIINAVHFGVPQNRKRLIFVAAQRKILKKNNNKFDWVYFEKKYREGPVNVGDVIRGLPRPRRVGEKIKNGENPLHVASNLSELNLRRIKQIRIPGGSRDMWNKEDNLECYKKHNGHTDVYGRMSWNKPAPTLTCKCTSLSNGRFGHPKQDRAISLMEAAILQTMDTYKFEEPIIIRKVAEQIGNAVPPKLAKKIGKFILELTF